MCTSIWPSMENFHDTRSINPQISIYLSGTGDAVAAQLQQTVDFLQSESVWDEDAFYAYIPRDSCRDSSKRLPGSVLPLL